MKTKDTTIYACINIKDFSIDVFTTKNQVADKIGCHRNTLITMNERMTYGNYVVIPTTLSKCRRHRA